MDWVELRDVRIQCHIGILDWEQERTQPLVLDLRMGLDLDGAAGGDLSRSVDYAAVLQQLTWLAVQGRWRLLESLGTAAARMLLLPPAEPRAPIERVVLSMHKPEVLGGAAVPTVRLERESAWAQLQVRELAPEIVGELLVETPHASAWRVRLAPGARWELPRGGVALRLAGDLPEGMRSHALRSRDGGAALVVLHT